ncbi:unnamed protein product [Thelazia callipaeda]|uniref:Calmodulin n=1 Tax=Thelazia callipaeda TaxID=103827 RepID=A0A0N5D9Z9_THECL|nr:unnamed protein product [Thelazia callipaeda]
MFFDEYLLSCSKILLSISDKRGKKICETFDLLDIDGDGLLSRDEMAALLKIIKVEPTRLELDIIFQEMDSNKTGAINKEDFVRYMSTPPTHRTTISELERYFRIYDGDGDGAIEIAFSDEAVGILKETMQVTDREMIEKIFQLTDSNQDGLISFDEFMNMIKESSA